MFANERHFQICDILKKHGAVTTSELVNHFNVSVETIRRDLLMLERSGKLTRVHGGAMSIGEEKPVHELSQRLSENEHLKKELSISAMRYIENGDTLAVCAGSTSVFFAETLKETFTTLTVVTYSLDVFEILSGQKNFSVILCGGEFYPRERALCGSFALDMLKSFHVNKSILFPYAVSFRNGICDYNTALLAQQQQLIKCGSQVLILADSSKFEKTSLLKISDMTPAYTYITDSGLPAELKKFYLENGINIISGKED